MVSIVTMDVIGAVVVMLSPGVFCSDCMVCNTSLHCGAVLVMSSFMLYICSILPGDITGLVAV
jgi:hypothetical protein